MKYLTLGSVVAVTLVVTILADEPAVPGDTLPEAILWDEIPEGILGKPPGPADNPMTPEKVRLGRRLFFDPVLSGDGTVSCASCHDPEHGFAGPSPVAAGIGRKMGTRNAPTLWNVGYSPTLFWDGRANSLEEQVLLPIENPQEMGSTHADVVKRLRADEAYVREFRAVFGDESITIEMVAKAIASFERVLVRGNSPVDFFRASETEPITDEAKQGLWLFESRGRCWKCHAGQSFSDHKFHNTGVGWKPGSDPGRFAVTKDEADRGKFKTPTLRALTLTAPYMHDGSLRTLEEVVRFYNKGGVPNPNLDAEMKPLNLDDRDVRHLVAFLESLTGRPAWER